MKKVKVFTSVLKERDWLEEMARQGFLLKDIVVGIIYEFESIEPSEKVYEIERFALSMAGYATKQELTSRKMAFDIAEQMGWKNVAHDENLNYYFVKDKAGDETDQFYENEENRRVRADKYRRAYCLEIPKLLLSLLLMVAVAYLVLFLVARDDPQVLITGMGIFIAVTIFEVAVVLYTIFTGEKMYQELMLSREQWEMHKKYSEKKNFKKSRDLINFLQKKDEMGLTFTEFKDGKYHFERTDGHFAYYVDTKGAIKRRMKKIGQSIERDKKDWENLGTNWQEKSMEEARLLGLEPICMVENGTLIYRRNSSDSPVIWDNEALKTGYAEEMSSTMWIWLALLGVGFLAGFFMAFLN